MGPPCLNEELPDPMCPVTLWSDWSPCSASCGKGVKLRTRLLLVEPGLQEKCSGRIELFQQRPCTEKVDCTLDMATAKRTQKFYVNIKIFSVFFFQEYAWKKRR